MMGSGLRISRIEIRNFGKIREFRGTLSDRVFVDNSYEGSSKIYDLLLVIKNFLRMGLHMTGDDTDGEDIIGEFSDKVQKQTHIEIGFEYDRHSFIYVYCRNDDVTNEYIRDVGSKFTIHGKLLFDFMSYVMNPYYMDLLHIEHRDIDGFNTDLEAVDAEVDLIWYALKHYEPIEGLIGIFDFVNAEYDEIVSGAMRRYGYGVTLVDKFSVRLTDDGLKAYINGEEAPSIARLSDRYQMAFLFARRIVACYLIGEILGIEDINRKCPPMLLDANFEDSDELNFEEAISLLKDSVFRAPRQIIIVEGMYINRLLNEDISIAETTRIYDSDLGLHCVTKSVS